jgi:Host cell surface-exposed lipoprotein.
MNLKKFKPFFIALVVIFIGVEIINHFKPSQNNNPQSAHIETKKKYPKKPSVTKTKETKKSNKSNKSVTPVKERTDQSVENTTAESTDSDSTSPTSYIPQPSVPHEYTLALEAAESYASSLSMSKQGIYEQLISEYGEGFSAAAAQYAINNMYGNWNNNALESAKIYQEDLGMSPEEIRDQLTSEYGDSFSSDEADYAVSNLY